MNKQIVKLWQLQKKKRQYLDMNPDDKGEFCRPKILGNPIKIIAVRSALPFLKFFFNLVICWTWSRRIPSYKLLLFVQVVLASLSSAEVSVSGEKKTCGRGTGERKRERGDWWEEGKSVPLARSPRALILSRSGLRAFFPRNDWYVTKCLKFWLMINHRSIDFLLFYNIVSKIYYCLLFDVE